MQWREEGALLAVRPHGESAAIIEVFTAGHGRHAGVVRGGSGRRLAPVLQPGAQLDVTWQARLDAHLGAFTVEPVRARAPALMTDRLALSGLNAVCGLLAYALPERAAMPELYARTVTLLDLMAMTPAWTLAYLDWEQALLTEMGFGLDLSVCAVTGMRDDLAFVSPRTGRSVSRVGAGDWADRLMPLPRVLLGEGEGSDAEIAQALGVTGFFLERHLEPRWAGQPFPPARARLVALLAGQPSSVSASAAAGAKTS